MPARMAFGAIADLARGRRAGKNLLADGCGVFAARIVVGDDHAVGELCRGLAHQRTLALVAIAAAAEHHVQLAGDMRAQWR